MHQATTFQFERIAKEFAAWRAVSPEERSPAAAWWWGPAFEVLGDKQTMPSELCESLEMAAGSSFGDAGAKLIEAIAEQTSLPWPDQFPRQTTRSFDEPQDILPVS